MSRGKLLVLKKFRYVLNIHGLQLLIIDYKIEIHTGYMPILVLCIIPHISSAICNLTGEIVLADDSGLEIDYLNKEPGIYSARYMGEDTSYHIKNANLIERLEGVPDEKRTARFVCAIAAAFPDGTMKTVRAAMEGRIGYKESGENGFGYDPIFYLPEYGCTSAELSMEEKNKISHRGKALRAIKDELR